MPGQYRSGGKAPLGRITKAGDAYLRSLLVLGARAVLNAAAGWNVKPINFLDAMRLALNPGMLVAAEIHQGRCSVLEYLLSPVRKVTQEAARER